MSCPKKRDDLKWSELYEKIAQLYHSEFAYRIKNDTIRT